MEKPELVKKTSIENTGTVLEGMIAPLRFFEKSQILMKIRGI
ncbi:MAG: hypothetical protein ACP5U0_08885 [Caldisphaera sp.]